MAKCVSKVLTDQSEKDLIDVVSKNPKYKLIILLMLDCGLRVTEVASMKVEYINVGQGVLRVPCLKKKELTFRDIPMTYRVKDALADYLYKKNLKSYLFPTKSETGHITRISIYRYISKHTGYAVKPHDLRHAFASKNDKNGVKIGVIQDLLGHTSSATTERYLHRPFTEKIEAIRALNKVSYLEKLRRRFLKPKKINIASHVVLPKDVLVGRKSELIELTELVDKKVNTILLGPQGIGKSELLKSVKGDKVIRLDDFRSVKKTLGNLLLHLYNGDKGQILDLLSENCSINTVITKESTARLTTLMTEACDQNEYTLVIDDISSVTASGVTVLDKLKNHFHIVAAARTVKVVHESFLSNFQKIKLSALTRSQASKMIFLLSQDFRDRIESFQAYKTHILNQSDCVPLYVVELIERYSKEQYISVDDVLSVNHFKTKKTFDFSIVVVLFLSSLMVLRYLGSEVSDDSGAFKLFGGVFLVFALFARSLFRVGKRRFV